MSEAQSVSEQPRGNADQVVRMFREQYDTTLTCDQTGVECVDLFLLTMPGKISARSNGRSLAACWPLSWAKPSSGPLEAPGSRGRANGVYRSMRPSGPAPSRRSRNSSRTAPKSRWRATSPSSRPCRHRLGSMSQMRSLTISRPATGDVPEKQTPERLSAS